MFLHKQQDAMTAGNTEDVIELRVDEIAQLFHTFDPFPFRERDLDREAEDFIVSWARELPVDKPIRIVIHFPDNVAQTLASRELGDAFSRYFSHRAGIIQRDLKELFRVGRRSLALRRVRKRVRCALYFGRIEFRVGGGGGAGAGQFFAGDGHGWFGARACCVQ